MPDREDGKKNAAPRWFCGVPILANPLILTDFLTALVLVWFFTVLIMALAQLLLGSGGLLPSHLTAATVYASYLAALLSVVFIATVVIFYPKGYVMLYRLEDKVLYMESMRGSVAGGGLFRTRPFAVGDEHCPARSVTKEVAWEDVRAVRAVESMYTIILKGKRGSLGRIYCPDDEAFRAALQFVRRKVEENGRES